MADYGKLTVVKLKDELKQRGLPTTGLKAVLVARLVEADHASQDVAPAASHDGLRAQEEQVQGGEMRSEDARPRDGDATIEPVAAVAPVVEDTPAEETHVSEKKPVLEERPAEDTHVAEDHLVLEDRPALQDTPTVESTPAKETHVAGDRPLKEDRPPLESRPLVEATHTVEDQVRDARLEEVQEEIHTGHAANGALLVSQSEVSHHEISPSLPASVPSQAPPQGSQPAQDTETSSPAKLSTQTSINREELMEDTRKRKRRSHSPPVSSMDVAIKKAKAEDGSPRVKLPEDAGSRNEGGAGSDRLKDVADGEASTGKSLEGIPNEHGQDQDTKMAAGVDEVHTNAHETAKPDMPRAAVDSANSTIKSSSTDPRFKNLFPPKGKAREASPPPADGPHQDEREIPPSRHAATAAIYIRNFMRPLHPDNLKSHLTSLAQPPHASPNPNIISTFFLDAIRTHCLVQCANVSAASRIRAALHDSVWPNERDRKPLFVDFVPEEKLSKWIEVERESSAKGASAKRWEVVYEEEEGKVTAYLQEADGAPRPIAKPVVARSNGDRFADRMEHPPTAPAIAPPPPRGDPGKGFKALDDLFQSTTAKPKLYYQPVSPSTADARLERLAAGRGGGSGNEMRRYTFEDELIVDKGPEFGAGWRGGYRGRGGGYGAGHPRGGSHRDSDAWRPR